MDFWITNSDLCVVCSHDLVNTGNFHCKIQILLNDVKHSINHMQGTLNTMQGQCIELQTAISKVVSDESQIQKNKSMMVW